MTEKQLEHILANIERTGRGWVHGGEIPACDVLLDGALVKHVLAANRKRGMLRVCHTPIQLDKHRKQVRVFTLRGVVTLAPKQVKAA